MPAFVHLRLQLQLQTGMLNALTLAGNALIVVNRVRCNEMHGNSGSLMFSAARANASVRRAGRCACDLWPTATEMTRRP